MSKISFLINQDIWENIPKIIKASKRSDVVVAYLGTDGSKLLPLKKGDRLVVDMSIATVKSGATNPHEVEKLIKRGVQVFTRRNLHAKIIATDKELLTGSANVSKNSRDVLEEAAVLTDDKIACQRARSFINRICTEPVLPEYLKECKKSYKPPRITGKGTEAKATSRRTKHAKLRIVSLIDYADFPESEIEDYENSEKKANKFIKDKKRSVLKTFNWPHRPKWADDLEQGDWFIECIKHSDKSISVYPPSQLILLDHYIRDTKTGKERYVFHLEAPKGGQKMDWKIFRRKLNKILSTNKKKPPTMAIRDTQQADELLRLWTPKGRKARKIK
ncbi:MAG: hypothetical protein DCC56_01240 [Anaerolineae bacterium]|nr:MAG: hypothetical protein DCC56_01240 [Anaerolineae bacterium]WKZ44660.1 MAG: phospholipase D family protein [Anaerolineales bacterium]